MWKYHKLQGRQSGFTLIELAIVLVIIGLILAAVLKGQEMIQNARVKNVINDLRGVASAYYAYQDRYKSIPGDDAHASSHFTGGVNGSGDGIITGTFRDSDIATESGLFWQHTRMAGFTTGTATATTAPAPTNAVGGLLGVQDGTTTNVYGLSGPVVCSGSIPWKIAQAVDTVIDDGDSATGNVRAGAMTTTVNAVTVAGTSAVYGSAVAATTTLEADIGTLCMKL